MRIDSPIRVGAIFGPGPLIRPVWFDWQQRKYTITEVTYRWQQQEGDSPVLHFAVSDGISLFELAYHTVRQTWQLATLEAPQP